MPRRLDTRSPGFEAEFDALLNSKRETDADVDDVVAAIIADVRQRGDAALIEYTARFDRMDLTPEKLRFTPDEIAAARADCDAETLDALETAARRIRDFHERQVPSDDRLDRKSVV